jgi:hypothetical protein
LASKQLPWSFRKGHISQLVYHDTPSVANWFSRGIVNIIIYLITALINIKISLYSRNLH